MRYALVLGIVSVALGEPRPPLGILRADLLSWEGTRQGGVLQLRLDSGIDYSCNFTSATFFERDRVRIHAGKLRPGDKLHVMSDRTSPGAKCFARMVKIVAEHEAPFQWGSVRRATESFAPRGALVLSGVVVRSDAEAFVIRTRTGERHRIRIRPDTHFLDNGAVATLDVMITNRQVFVRAGFNSDEEIEAYQVISGEILQPTGPTMRQP
jgi:hypothetical protein